MTHKIRTTMQPTVELEVGDAEYLDLKRQGLLVDDSEETTGTDATAQREQPAPAAPATPDQAQAPAPAAPSKAAKAVTKEG